MGAIDEAERLLSPSPPAAGLATVPQAAPLAAASPRRCSQPSRRHRLGRLIMATMISMLVVALWLLVFLPQTLASNVYHGYRSAFSFDSAADIPSFSAWQAQLDDATPLAALSLPGTHDTMTYAMETDRLQCQNEALATQLRAGLRYFDIRLRIRVDGSQAPELCVFHADGFTGFCLDEVLRQMVAFLNHEPSEALVVRIKQEGTPVGGTTEASFESLFKRYIAHDDVAPHIYAPKASSGPANASFPIPELGALRSRILLLQDFPAAAGPAIYGPAWDGPQMALEDDWITMDLFHLADKWVSIRNALVNAAMDLSPTNASSAHPPLSRLFLAHISASVGVLPIAAAAGPKDLDITGLNDMTGQFLEYFGSFADVRGVGIVIFDFPGSKAIRAVVDMNKAPQKRCKLSKTPFCNKNILQTSPAS
ncbi:hypothetical protein CDD82_1241 [Ophiocordyceps australis]|uniref:Phosphatidylinositol-specific phospholipase C X domain-containing protein n=1 Tax=Ophiocordyceps australis TaxID=1399860 RepID=A0A2C5ZJK8_9HYPO|nr:hypothetical protein CDD82_1241 [Ophiocordyceps australis]